jgi:hypothetical protein
MTPSNEQIIGQFTGWYRRTSVSLEFWEGVLTDRRLIWCFVGESFKSLLLRADMGTYGREEIADLSPDAIATFDNRNIVVALEKLQTIHLAPGSLIRRPSLVVEWCEDTTQRTFKLRGTSGGDPQASFVESLAEDNHFSHIDIAVEKSRLGW